MSTGNGAREYHDMSLPATSTPRPYTASHDDDRDSNAPEVADSEFSSPTTLTTSSPHGTHSTLHSPTAQQAGLEHYTPSKHFQQDEGKIAILSQEQYTTYPEVVASPYSKKEDTPNIAAAEEGDSAPQPQKDRKILGMRRKIFFLVLALVCIIIAAAVGGGVGASASHNSSKSPDPTPAPSPSSDVGASSTSSSASGASTSSAAGSGSGSGSGSSSSSPGSSTSTPSTSKSSSASKTSSTATATPTFLNQTNIGSGFGFQGFSGTNFHSPYTDLLVVEGETETGADFKFPINSYEWIARITNCCVSFCNNATSSGWIGYQCQTKKQPKTSEGFTRVWVWCEDDHQEDNARGKCSAGS
ncbi:hypothetical protein NQ176_g3509 [Zarea fungicola]|uniref:Uncharacterized protein n=1 Tax=Zarea fungicola TaxID=93591 RepID=A0ACC1NJ85_9HYPO|nr:hypothetical protein NQ176_g3509 [Lecanicillium fungicola]